MREKSAKFEFLVFSNVLAGNTLESVITQRKDNLLEIIKIIKK